VVAPVDAAGAGEAAGGGSIWMIAGAFALAAVVAGGAVAVRRARAREDEEEGASVPVKRKPPREKLSRRERKRLEVPLDAEPPVPPIAVCLTIVRGSTEGAEHRFLLERRAAVGSGRSCQVVVGDSAVDREQVELTQERGAVYARNLSRVKPTLLNGVPLAEAKPIANGDLLGSRDFIVRVRFG
jgi:hypothetical protein